MSVLGIDDWNCKLRTDRVCGLDGVWCKEKGSRLAEA